MKRKMELMGKQKEDAGVPFQLFLFMSDIMIDIWPRTPLQPLRLMS